MNLLSKIDDGIMYGVNAGIHIYNWTFGGTKEDLADIMQVGAAAIEIIRPLAHDMNGGIVTAIVRAPFSLTMTYCALKTNRKQMQLESESVEKLLMDKKVEGTFKPANKLFAYVFFPASFAYDLKLSSDTSHNQDLGYHYADMVASPVRSLGCLTICGVNLPPRKNIISRTADKIGKFIIGFGESPAKTYSKTRLEEF